MFFPPAVPLTHDNERNNRCRKSPSSPVIGLLFILGAVLVSLFGQISVANAVGLNNPVLGISKLDSSDDDPELKDTTIFLCGPEEICFELHGDDSDGDNISLSKISGTGYWSMYSSDDSTMDTTFCFTPDTAGVYCFVFELDDDIFNRGIIESDDDVDTICITVVFNTPPVIVCPPNVTLQCGDPTDPANTGFATADSVCTTPSSSCPCSGGIRLLSLRTRIPYAGGVVSVEARAAKSGFLDTSPYGVDTESFDGTLFTSATFSGAVAITRMELIGTDSVEVTYTVDVGLISLLKMSSNSEFRVSSSSATNQQAIHTSCSQPIAPPFDFGAFSIVGLVDKSGSVCNLDSTSCTTPVITFVDDTTSVLCPLIISRTWIATDSCGNADSCVQTITVQDTTAPVVTCPPAVNVQCSADIPAADTSLITATDNCTGDLVKAFVSDVSDGQTCPETITRTYSVSDGCNNVGFCTQTITVNDTIPPVISCPSSVVFDCVMGNAGTATATDNCGIKEISSVDNITSARCPLIIERTWIATDSCGNADSCVQLITVQDTIPPVASCPANLTTFVWGTDSARVAGFKCSDNCSIASSSVNYGALSGDTVSFLADTTGIYTFILTCTDTCGLSAACTTEVTVRVNTAPVASCPGDTALWACDLSPICIKGFSCTDIDGNLKSSTVSNGVLDGDSVCFTPVNGANTIILICVDSCGAADTCATVVNVTLDVSPPKITCPDNISVQCIGDVPTPDTSLVTAIDSCDDGPIKAFVSDVSDGQKCPETITRTYKTTDVCGNEATCTQTITVNDTIPPVISCPDNVVFDCVMGNAGTATATDNCGIKEISSVDSITSARCPLIIDRTWIATDSCGNADSCVQSITVQDTIPPVASCPANLTTFVWATDTARVAGFTCSDNCSIASSSVNYGILSGDTVSFLADTTGVYSIILTCVDSCGLSASCTTAVTVTVNTRPDATCPTGPIDRTVCDLSPICIKGFSCTDIDGNLNTSLTTVTVNGNSVALTGDSVCFTPINGANTIVLICVDSCEAADTCTTIVNVDLCPKPDLGADLVIDYFFQCNPFCDTISAPPLTGGCAPFTWTVNGQAFDPNTKLTFCFNECATTGYSRIFIVTDSCGRADTATISAAATVNCPPKAICPPPITVFACDTIDICIPGFSCSDQDGNIKSSVIRINGVINSSACVPSVPGDYLITLTCTDICDAIDICTTLVTVDSCPPKTCPKITIVQADSVLQGHNVCLSITSEGSTFDLGGFDFMIAYDQSALTALNATPGDYIVNCDWEYFTYRFGPFGNCSVGCPSGLLKILAVAETNDGFNHPACFGPPNTDPITLAKICFLVSNDRTLECQFARVRFFWTDCTDNVLSDRSGDTLLVSRDVFMDQNPISIADGATGFPTETGIQNSCFVGLNPNKPAPQPCVDFCNGGVRIICADEIDARGDLNLNGLSNEIADAVVYTSYFIEGLASFKISVEGQIAASDVNADGVVLSVADLVYQIRIITGDAAPIPKLAHFKQTATISISAGVVSTDLSLGAVLITLKGRANAELLARGVEMATGIVDGNTRVLVYSIDGAEIDAGAIIETFGEILEVEAADYFGSALNVALKATPTDFALHQNYPNPFNPATKIAFDLPVSSGYVLSVYNITGQKIAEFSGDAEPGTVVVEWDATAASSGVYFYRLVAGSYAATKKMVFLK